MAWWRRVADWQKIVGAVLIIFVAGGAVRDRMAQPELNAEAIAEVGLFIQKAETVHSEHTDFVQGFERLEFLMQKQLCVLRAEADSTRSASACFMETP